jgi:hypothetical protein
VEAALQSEVLKFTSLIFAILLSSLFLMIHACILQQDWLPVQILNTNVQGKGKFHPITVHEGPKGERMYSPTLSLTLVLDRGGWLMPCPGHFAPRRETGDQLNIQIHKQSFLKCVECRLYTCIRVLQLIVVSSVSCILVIVPHFFCTMSQF